MTLEDFDKTMNDAQAKVLAMPKTTPWERYLYNEARGNLMWADCILREQIKDEEASQ